MKLQENLYPSSLDATRFGGKVAEVGWGEVANLRLLLACYSVTHRHLPIVSPIVTRGQGATSRHLPLASTMEVNFRKIDIDQYDEDVIQENELYEADPRDPAQVLNDTKQKAAAVRSSLSKYAIFALIILGHGSTSEEGIS